MKILVLLAGVQDPKWPVAPANVLSGESDRPAIMSPFDEAALEMALRVRDADPGTEIAVRVAGGVAASKIAREVAALRIEDVATITFAQPWDQAATARALASQCRAAELVLIGREFGDFDDGLVPALLAGVLDRPFFGRAQTIATQGEVRLLRETGLESETLAVSGWLVASVTNDRRTRLRKPLMKNVMLARQADIAAIAAEALPSGRLSLEGLRPRIDVRAATECAMLDGTATQQAAALATILWEGRA